jgi:hypothetical protein
MPSQLMSALSHVHNCSLSVFYIKADHPSGPDPQESAMPTFKRNPLLHVALLTAGASLWHPALASAQATVQFDAAIPPGMAEALKQYGIEIPQDRVKGAVHIQQGADGSLDVRFNQTADTPEPKQALRNEGQEPAVIAVPSSPPAPPKSSEPPSGQARSEAPIPREPKATAAAFDGTWSVSLTANGGFLCSRVPSQTLTVQNGAVRGGSGVSVSGQVEPSGSISLALQKSGIRGSASGTLSGASGAGSWTAPSLGCSGRWTAQRRSTVTAQAS